MKKIVSVIGLVAFAIIGGITLFMPELAGFTAIGTGGAFASMPLWFVMKGEVKEFKELTEDQLKDLSDEEFGQYMSAKFDGLEKFSAVRIARTETIWAWNAGAVEGYKQSGIIEKKIWVSSDDSRTCVWCPTMDGKVISVEATFFPKGETLTVQGQTLSFEYSEVGHPPLHPNCRCSVAPVIEDI